MTNWQNYRRYAWFVVAYMIFVILWGAVVRATGSGAGCGNHWPACNGQVIPRAESIETLIEFSHRLTSAFAGVLVMVMLGWAYRLKPRKTKTGDSRSALRFLRLMAVMTFIFILIEGGIGAALVRLELVENNASTLRAVMIAIHLANTLVLLLFNVLTAWAANQDEVRFKASVPKVAAMGIALIGFMLMSSAGAVTALGDTLFLSGALHQVTDNPYDHFLIQLRVYHPVLAVIVSVYLFGFGYYLFNRHSSSRIHDRTQQMMILIGIQLAVGVLNIFLQAPIWMQILHLFLADALWVVLILLSAEIFTTAEQPSELPTTTPEPLPAVGD